MPFPDPCVAPGCNVPYNVGCRVVNNRPVCICPTCPNTLRPVCASDSVQDLSECHLRRQACQGNITLTVAKQGPCGMFVNHQIATKTLVCACYIFMVHVLWYVYALLFLNSHRLQ